MSATLLKTVKHCILACCLAGLAACDNGPEQPLRIGSSPWPGYEPLFLARDLGYFEGQNLKLFEVPSSDINVESFRNRSTDMATVTLDETLELLSDGTKLKIVLILDISHGGDAVMASPAVKNFADVKGKRISIVNIPLGLYMLNRFLDKAGVARGDVQVFPMAESKQEKFYQQGKADLVITFDPVKTHLAEMGMSVLFDSSDIPNEIFDIVVVHEDIYQARKDEICEFAKQWYRALDYIENNKADAAARISKRMRVNVSEFDNIMAGLKMGHHEQNKELLGGDNPGLLTRAERLTDIMIEENLMDARVDVTSAIDNTFVDCHAK